MVKEAWETAEILFNSLINDLFNQNRHSDAREMENHRDILKIALQMSGYELEEDE